MGTIEGGHYRRRALWMAGNIDGRDVVQSQDLVDVEEAEQTADDR